MKSRKPGTFQPGNKVAVGNKGGGRKPDWFKAKMAEIASSDEAVGFVEDVIKGKDVDEFLVLQTGVQVPVKADAATRLKFLQFAKESGYGKDTQPIEIREQILLVRPAKDE